MSSVDVASSDIACVVCVARVSLMGLQERENVTIETGVSWSTMHNRTPGGNLLKGELSRAEDNTADRSEHNRSSNGSSLRGELSRAEDNTVDRFEHNGSPCGSSLRGELSSRAEDNTSDRLEAGQNKFRNSEMVFRANPIAMLSAVLALLGMPAAADFAGGFSGFIVRERIVNLRSFS